MTPTRIKAYSLLLIVSVIWGVAAVVIKLTLKGIPPLPFLAYRFFISFVIAVIALTISKPKLPKGKTLWIGVITYSVLSTTIALGFLFLGLEKTTVLNLSMITLVSPLLVEAAGVVFLKENLTKREKAGTAIAVIGSIFTVIEPILEAGTHIGELSGNILLLIYLISDIASIVILKKIIKHEISPFALSHVSFIVGFITIVPLALFSLGFENIVSSIGSLNIKYHAGVWYMAVMSGTIAYALRAKGQKYIEIGEGALFTYLVSVFSAPLAVILLGESLTIPFLIGTAIIAAGVFIAEYRQK